jgi:DNA-binding GntR family transcriptional regulator
MKTEPSSTATLATPNIARHLTEAITSGHFKVGGLLPTELELCKHYEASRYAVRAALAELQQMGLVSRRKNVGTRVVSARPRSGFRPSLTSVDDLVQFGTEHLRIVRAVAQTTVTDALAKELGCASGTPRLRVSTLRMVGNSDAPIGWTDIYIDPSYTDVAELARTTPDMLISALIEDRYGRHIAEIQQDVRGCLIDDRALAKELNVAPGSAGLRIVRRYYDADGEAFEGSVAIHPADRFSLSMLLRRSAG